ncbi:MAG TPA: non-ribosomal peptide synthetase [Streptomyces sp.]|uniref:non-ribosomal peptide synthetase n=1 Tax=Streptomyces sp. TaxID=1931 RepID=UPI002B92B80D|nr:non-ribosomal peptide synthetase [Streptomyces sp.]HWU10184.1 non-ribosomal peptide synthetase [Streptomyces sp.]
MSSITAPFREPVALIPLSDVDTMFREAVAKDPDYVAVTDPHSALTYRELNLEADRVAEALKAHGIADDDVVAVEDTCTVGAIAGLIGVWRAGGVIMPLDPALPDARRRKMMDTARPAAVIKPSGMWPDAIHRLDKDFVCSSQEHVTVPRRGGYIFFTSGSTGEPKAVVGAAQGLAHFVSWQRDTFALGPGDRFGQLTRWSFDVMLREVFTPLTAGATLCLPGDRHPDPRSIFQYARQQQVTVLHVVPSLARLWLLNDARDLVLPDLRTTFFAGEPLEGALVQKWRDRVQPDARVVNLYGPTETTLAKCMLEVPHGAQGPLPVGHPLPGCEVAIFTPGTWECPAPGEPGEIVIRTPYRSSGYLSATAFAPNPFRSDPDDLLYRTGDRGIFDDEGQLHVLGRMDDQVKVRGVRIALREVARALESVSGVTQAAVIDHKHDGQTQLHAYVAAADPKAVPLRELRQAVSAALPPAAVPSRITLVGSLPLLPNGKVDRTELRRRSSETESTAPAAPEATPAPHVVAHGADDALTYVMQVCQRSLELDSLGPDDDLFDLGVDSLLALEIATALEESYGVELGLGVVFEAPTVRELTARVAELTPAPSAGSEVTA